jgi:Protein of unknown function (DUF935)
MSRRSRLRSQLQPPAKTINVASSGVPLPSAKNNPITNLIPSMVGNPQATLASSTPIYVTDSPFTYDSYTMGHYDTIFGPTMRFAQWNPDRLISQRGFLQMKEMMTMAAVRAPMMVKKASVVTEYDVKPKITDYRNPNYEKAKEMKEYCEYCLDNIKSTITRRYQPFHSVLWQLADAIHYGFGVAEKTFTKKILSGKFKGKHGLDFIAPKPCWEFGFEFFNTSSFEPAAVVPYTPMDGYQSPVPIEKVMLFTYNPDAGLPYGNGDCRANFKHYYILDNLVKFWAWSAERWGSPVLILKHPPMDDTARAEALYIASQIRNGGDVVLPQNMSYELIELRAEALRNFKEFADWNISQISLNTLGNSLTTSEGERFGSGALGNVHQGTQNTIINYCRQSLQDVVENDLFKTLIFYSYGEEYVQFSPLFRFNDKISSAELTSLATAFNQLISVGTLSPYAYEIRERLHLDPIDQDEIDEIDSVAQMLQEMKSKMQNVEKPGKQENRASK